MICFLLLYVSLYVNIWKLLLEVDFKNYSTYLLLEYISIVVNSGTAPSFSLPVLVLELVLALLLLILLEYLETLRDLLLQLLRKHVKNNIKAIIATITITTIIIVFFFLLFSSFETQPLIILLL